MKYLLSVSFILNLVFVGLLLSRNNNNAEIPAATKAVVIKGSQDCQSSVKDIKKVYAKSGQKEPELATISKVYILPHPPNFLEGRYLNISSFQKVTIDGKDYWNLGEVDAEGKLKKWQVRADSVLWK